MNMKPLYDDLNNKPESWYDKPGNRWKIIAGFGLFILLLAIFSKPLPKEEVKLTNEDRDRINAEAEAIARYDAKIKLKKDIRYYAKKHVKDNLKDPSSFEEIAHAETQVEKPTPLMHYQAMLKYRAKNSFGALVIETKCFNFNEIGGITEVFDCDL